MKKGSIYSQEYTPQFSGHETFPLRYGWLKKVYDRVNELKNQSANRTICWGEDAIAYFGVGKNMVSSMRHWAIVSGIIEENSSEKSVTTTILGDLLFSDCGLDPYMENASTTWLIHWRLATHLEKKTTWHWVFNYYPALNFEREQLLQQLQTLAKNSNWSKVSEKTLKNDIACFIRTYAIQENSIQSQIYDGDLECPLTELGLIKPVGKMGMYRLVRGPKPNLGDGVFTYALLEFWERFAQNNSTLSFEAVAYEAGAPGRAFLLDDNDLVDRLINLEVKTHGSLRWSETSGLKQIVRNPDFDLTDVTGFISSDYSL